MYHTVVLFPVTSFFLVLVWALELSFLPIVHLTGVDNVPNVYASDHPKV